MVRKNAAKGDESAYYLLAEIYCTTEKFEKAKKWALKSKATGNPDAELLWLKYNLEKY